MITVRQVRISVSVTTKNSPLLITDSRHEVVNYIRPSMKTDRVKLLLAVSIALTLSSGVITFFAIRESRDRLHTVFHTYKAISLGNKMLSLLKDAEAGQRGFLLTSDSLYLEPYIISEKEIPLLVDSMMSAVSDNPTQRKYLNDIIIPLIKRKRTRLERTLNVFATSGLEVTQNRIRTNEGMKIMDSLRYHLAQFNATEEALLVQRAGTMTHSLDRSNLTRYISFILIALVSLVAFITLGRSHKQNKDLILKLEKSNNSLEDKIKERTRELERHNIRSDELNEQLQQSMEEMASFYEALNLRNAKAEDALKDIRDLYDNAPCGYHSLDENGMIVRMNNRELGWLGYRRDEVIGKMHITQMLIPEEHQSYHEGYGQFKVGGRVINKEHTFVRKDSTIFKVLLNAGAVYDSDGKYLMSRGSVIDITDRKQMEIDLLKANQDLILMNKEKNHFLGIAAHDLKSPLQSILGLINLINIRNHNLTPEQLEYFRYIQRSCMNMQTLIDNLLDINKIEHGMVAGAPEEIQLRALSDNLMSTFQEQARTKNIALKVECNAPEQNIFVDINALSRILENLISNAIKFSRQHTEVLFTITYADGEICFDVVDQGQGIQPEDIPKLFRKFERLQTRPTNGESSTGLGLSIVKELVLSLNGRITVDSKPNKGSRFTVNVPLN
jgi:PAS domain S-box-containing protein